jgi:electron transfer flavoprotein beta subunit
VGVAALAEAQAMGADQAILVNDPALAGSDTLVTSKVLAAAIQRVAPFDLVLFGTRTSDSDTGQVGPQTATVLGIPFLGGVKQIDPQDVVWEMKRQMDDWEERWQVNLPAAVTIHPRAFAPRPIPLIGIAQAHDHLNVETWRLADVGLSANDVGLQGSPTRVAKLEKIKHRRTCRMLEGEPQAQVEALIAHLTTMGVMKS